jgi:EmrB/QacA subfamily drug resistance transporter
LQPLMTNLRQKKWWILIGVGLSGLIVGTDFTIVNTVLPDIERQFALSLSALQWIMTGFGITFAALLISAGKIGDLVGRRLVLYIGIIGFGLSSLAAGLSQVAWQLILARICQGIFASTIFPCGMAIVANAFKGGQQTRALSIYGGFLGMGMAIGPVMGGFITSMLNWRWIFLINLPIVLLTLLICFFTVEESRLEKTASINWLGMLLVSFGLGALVFAVTESQVLGWDALQVIAAFILSALLFTCFIRLERKAVDPLLPLSLFLNRPFFIGVMVYVVGIAFTWSVMFFVPLYLQQVLQFSIAKTGFLLLPMTLMTVIAPPIAGYMLHKRGPLVATVFSFAMSILSFALLLLVSANFYLPVLFLAFIGLGLSWGVANGIALPIALSHPSNQQHEGLISGAASTILNVVGVVTLAIASTLFYFSEAKQLLATQQASLAFMSGFHAVMGMLLVLTCISFIAVLRAFRGLL